MKRTPAKPGHDKNYKDPTGLFKSREDFAQQLKEKMLSSQRSSAQTAEALNQFVEKKKKDKARGLQQE